MHNSNYYIEIIQDTESRLENIRENIVLLRRTQSEFKLGTPAREKIDLKMVEAKEKLREIRDQLKQHKIDLRATAQREIKELKEKEILEGKKSRGRPPKGLAEMMRAKNQADKGPYHSSSLYDFEKRKRGRPRKRVSVEVSMLEELQAIRDAQECMNVRLALLEKSLRTTYQRCR